MSTIIESLIVEIEAGRANALLSTLDKNLERVGSQAVRTERSTDKLTAAQGRLARSGSQLDRAMVGQLRQLAAMAAAYLSISMAVGQLGSAVRIFTEFEASIAAVEAVTNAFASEVEVLSEQAKRLGEATVFSASQAANAMEFLGRAGFEVTEILSSMPGLLDLAAAGKLGLAEASDIAAQAIRGFNLDASESGRVADVLAAAASSANTDVQMMGEGMKFVAPVAASMGVSIEMAAAAMGVLSDAGLQSSMAGTGLRRVLSELVQPGAEATAVLRSMGISLAEVNPTAVSLTSIIDTLANAGLTAAEAFALFGDRGGPAILALTSQSDRLRELNTVLEDSEGTARRMAGTMLDTVKGAADELDSVIESLKIEFGEGLNPALRETLKELTELFGTGQDGARRFGETVGGALVKLIEVFVFLVRHIDQAKAVLLGFAVAMLAIKFGPAIAATFLWGQAFVALAASEGVAAVATMELSLAWRTLTASMLSNPIGIIAVALGVLVAVIYQVTKAQEDAEAAAAEYYERLRFGSAEIEQQTRQHQHLVDVLHEEIDARRQLSSEVDTARDRLEALRPVLEQMQQAVTSGDDQAFGAAVEAARALGMEFDRLDLLSPYDKLRQQVMDLERQVEESESGIQGSLRRTQGAEKTLAETVDQVVAAELQLRDEQIAKLLEVERQARLTRQALVDASAADSRRSGTLVDVSSNEVSGLSQELQTLEERAAQAREEIDRTNERIGALGAEANLKIGELFRDGKIEELAGFVQSLPEDLYKRIFPGTEVDETIEAYREARARLDEYAEAQARAKERGEQLSKEQQKELERYQELRTELLASTQDLQSIAAAYEESTAAGERATRQAELEARIREATSELTREHANEIRRLAQIQAEAEREASGSAVLADLQQQISDLDRLVAAYEVGLEVAAEVQRDLELEAQLRQSLAEAADHQAGEIISAIERIRAKQEEAAARRVATDISTELQGQERLIEAYGRGATAVREVTRALEIEATVKRELVEVTDPATRAALEAEIRLRERQKDVISDQEHLSQMRSKVDALRVQMLALSEGTEQSSFELEVHRRMLERGAVAGSDMATEIRRLAREEFDLQKVLAKATEFARRREEVWKNFAGGLQDALSSSIRTALDDGLDSFSDFGDAVVSLLKDAVAEGLSLLATKQVLRLSGSLDLGGAKGLAEAASKLSTAGTAAAAKLTVAGNSASTSLAAGGTTAAAQTAAGGTAAATAVTAGGAAGGSSLAAGGTAAGTAFGTQVTTSAGAWTISVTESGAILVQAAAAAGAELQAGGIGGGVTSGVTTGGTGWAGALAGAWPVLVAAAVLVGYAVWSDRKREKEFLTGATFEVSGGVRERQAFGDRHKLVDAMEEVLDAIEAVTGGLIAELPEIALRIRRDGERFGAMVADVYLGTFGTVEEAIEAGLRSALSKATLTGAAPEFEQLLSRPIESIEQLMADLELVSGALDWDLSPLQIEIRDTLRELDAMRERFQELGIATSAIDRQEIRVWTDWFHELQGSKPSAAELQAQTEQEARLFEASLAVRKADIAARIIELKIEREIVENRARFNFTGLRHEITLENARRNAERASLRGRYRFALATSELVTAELLAQSHYLEGQRGIYQAEQDLAGQHLQTMGTIVSAAATALDAQIAAYEELFAALDAIPKLDMGNLAIPGAGGGGGGRREAREEARREIEALRLEASGLARSAIDVRRGFADFNETLNEWRRLGIAEKELAQARRDNLVVTERDFLGRFEDTGRGRGFTGDLARLASDYADAAQEAWEIATEAAAVYGTTVEEEFARLAETLGTALGVELGELVGGELSSLISDGDVAGIRRLREEVLDFLDSMSPEMAANLGSLGEAALQMAANAREARDQIMESLQEYTDAVLGIGDFERQLLDLQERFAEAREGLAAADEAEDLALELAQRVADETTRGNEILEDIRSLIADEPHQAPPGSGGPTAIGMPSADPLAQVKASITDLGRDSIQVTSQVVRLSDAIDQVARSTDSLKGQMDLLDQAEKIAIQRIGIDFLGSLQALGINLPVEVTMELAHMQFELARAEAIAAAMALAAAGAFDNLSITLEDVLNLIEGADFELSPFNPNYRPPTIPTTTPTPSGPDPAEELARIRERIADQAQAWQDMLMDPLELQLLQMQRVFDDLRESLLAAGGSVAELAELEDSLAAAREHVISEAYQPIRDFLEELRLNDPSQTGSERFGVLRASFQEALAAVQGGDTSRINELVNLGRQLNVAGAGQFGTSTGAYRNLVRQIESQMGALLPEGWAPEDELSVAIQQRDVLQDILRVLQGQELATAATASELAAVRSAAHLDSLGFGVSMPQGMRQPSRLLEALLAQSAAQANGPKGSRPDSGTSIGPAYDLLRGQRDDQKFQADVERERRRRDDDRLEVMEETRNAVLYLARVMRGEDPGSEPLFLRRPRAGERGNP